jgi:hypothetical protein
VLFSLIRIQWGSHYNAMFRRADTSTENVLPPLF